MKYMLVWLLLFTISCGHEENKESSKRSSPQDQMGIADCSLVNQFEIETKDTQSIISEIKMDKENRYKEISFNDKNSLHPWRNFKSSDPKLHNNNNNFAYIIHAEAGPVEDDLPLFPNVFSLYKKISSSLITKNWPFAYGSWGVILEIDSPERVISTYTSDGSTSDFYKNREFYRKSTGVCAPDKLMELTGWFHNEKGNSLSRASLYNEVLLDNSEEGAIRPVAVFYFESVDFGLEDPFMAPHRVKHPLNMMINSLKDPTREEIDKLQNLANKKNVPLIKIVRPNYSFIVGDIQ